jgi:hypothetical protein
MAEQFMVVDDESVDRVTQAARGALILGKDNCDSCAAYVADIRRLQEQGLLGEVVVGKIVLTKPGCRAFKRENPWLWSVTYLPYTVSIRRVSAWTSSRRRGGHTSSNARPTPVSCRDELILSAPPVKAYSAGGAAAFLSKLRRAGRR